MNEEYELDIKKVVLVAGVLVAIILAIIAIPVGRCVCLSAVRDWNGEWNRLDDATYSRSTLTIHDTNTKGFYFSCKVYNGNLVGDAQDLYAEFRGDGHKTATYEIKDTDAYVEFRMEDGQLYVEFFSQTFVEAEVIEGFGYGASMTGIYENGEVEYLNTSLSQMEVLSEERDEILRRSISDEQYARLMNCFQSVEYARDVNMLADIYYGRMTTDDYAAIIMFYEDDTYSMIISTDGSNDMSYITNNELYTADLGAYPEPIQRWLNDYEENFYKQQNEAENEG